MRAGDETEIAFDGMPALLSTGILSRLSAVVFRILHCNRAPYSFTARCPLVAVSAKLTQILDDAEG